MLIKILPVGHLETNCYIVTDPDTLGCAVIDPGDESNTILDYVETHRLTVKQIFLTHGHYDHTGAAETVAEETGAPIRIHPADLAGEGGHPAYQFKPGCPVKPYEDGERIPVDSLTFDVLETPGHSPGSVTLVCQEAVFCGDTLFRDSCGRTDLPGGSMEVLLQSLRKLSQLPGQYEVYPGHMEATDLDRERKFNYYMRYANEVQ